MTIAIRALLYGVGLLVCAWKHLYVSVLLLIPGQQTEKEELYDGIFGLRPGMHPRVDAAFENLRREPHRWAHHLTDVVVEHTRAHPQRNGKAYAFMIVVPWVALLLNWML